MKPAVVLLLTVLAWSPVRPGAASDAFSATQDRNERAALRCTGFGPGYILLPGSETCLRMGGYARTQAGFGTRFGLDADGDGSGDSLALESRLAIRLSTALDTENGPLTTYSTFTFRQFSVGRLAFRDTDADPATPPVVAFGIDEILTYAMDDAWIDYFGFRIGYSDSNFTTWIDYAGDVISDDEIGHGPYGTSFVRYRYDSGKGLTAMLAAEFDQRSGGRHAPNLVAGVGLSMGNLLLGAVAGYDGRTQATAVKARIDVSQGPLQAFAMAAYDFAAEKGVANYYAPWSGTWAFWAGGSYRLAENLRTNAQFSADQGNNYSLVANAVYTVTSRLSLTTELTFTNFANSGRLWGGILRLQRSW